MIFFNGSTGGLGRYFLPEVLKAGLEGRALHSRLEEPQKLVEELNASLTGKKRPMQLTLVQLAAMVSVPACEQDPAKAHQINVIDTLATVSAFISWAQKQSIRPRILYVSSGHVYDEKARGERANEEDAVRPRSIYAKTKLDAENAIRALAAKDSAADLLIARVFGLIAPGQPKHYVLPNFIQRVRDANLSQIPGLSNVRDYLDARDVCAHLAFLSGKDWYFSGQTVLNICSGEPISLEDLLKKIVNVMGVDRSALQNKLSPAPGRPGDLPWIVGNPARLSAQTGRNPRSIPLDQTIADALKS